MRQSAQDYLKAIASLALSREYGVVKPKEIAQRLDISPAAVTDMVRKLESDGYVTAEPYKGVMLTEKGRRIGANMIRHHRLWEAFLHQELGLSWDQVHDEAERLEHACSDALIDKIEEKLGFPRFDPHGHPIPDKDGRLPTKDRSIPLLQARIGKSYRITRVSAAQDDLAWLARLGLGMNACVIVSGRLQKDDTLVLDTGKGGVMLSAIWAEAIEGEEI